MPAIILYFTTILQEEYNEDAMPIFTYTAAKQNGEIVKGVRDAENKSALAQELRQEELFLLEAREKKQKLAAAGWNIDIGRMLSYIRPIGLEDKMFFSRNLAVMVGAGISLPKALDALASELSNKKLADIISEVSRSVVKGKSFANSLETHKDVFGELFTNMVEVGETTGKLGRILKVLASQMKKDYDLRKRVRGALIYPAIIITALAGIGILMMVYVVPSLTATIKELGVELPATTIFIIAVSDFLSNNSLFMSFVFALAAGFMWRLLKTRRGKEVFDRIVLRIPIFGALIKKLNIARFCRSLAYLISSGVPIVRSLEITANVLTHTQYRSVLKTASREIQKGKQLHIILEPHKRLFPVIVIQMIGVGEETGKISSMMLRLALFYEEEVENTTKNLSSVIEPILMVVIGAAVGFFAISMLQPIYSSLGNL